MTRNKLNKDEIKESLANGFRALITLVKMQLKEKMDLGYLRSKRKMVFKLAWIFIEFAAITSIISVLFYFIKLFGLFSLVRDIPVSVVSLVFGFMLLLSVITDTVGLMKSLYFSKDNSVLLTLPSTPSLVFFSKLATYYIYELRKSFMFTIPMFIAYGIVKGYGFIYYPWLIFMFVLISVIPVLLAALLSIPSMFAYIFLCRVKLLQYLLYTAVGAVAILAAWQLIALIPDNINFIESWGDTYWEIQAFLADYTRMFAPIYAFTELIVGKTIGITSFIFHSSTVPNLIIVIVIALVLLLLCFLCSKPLFCRMASTPFEFKRRNAVKEKFNYKLPTFVSAMRKEIILHLRSNAFIKLGGVLIVIMPIAIFLLNKIYSAMNTRFLGTQMTICFNILIILLILLMTNIDIASVYSRDGSSASLNKVQPTPYAVLLVSKLIFPMVLAFAGTVLTVNVFAIEAGLKPLDALMIGIAIYGAYVAHLFSSAESDIMNPQYEQYATFNEQANNPNESSSGIMAITISMVVFVFALFLSSRGDPATWIKLAVIMCTFAGFKILTYLAKIKAFYKEKQ